MSRHRIKAVGYDDEELDDYDDDGYNSEEQEFAQQCSEEVFKQLRTGDSPVTATREEVQESLWHYYNDVEKTVNYIRSEWYYSFVSTRSASDLECANWWLAPCRQEGQGDQEEAERAGSGRKGKGQ